jgi:hypothetical protein
MPLSDNDRAATDESWVSSAMLRSGAATLRELVDHASDEYVVDQIYRAMNRTRRDSGAANVYEGLAQRVGRD